ncbi:MAG: GNAT family N-acetyltransferase [bacterium]|nr:GNAT family N-acetyltransferase [bacterium]
MITIRQLKKEDATAVAALIPQLTQNIIEPEKLLQRLESMTSGDHYKYFVAELDSQVVGLAGLVWYPIPSKGLIGWVEEVVVDEQFRGQGIGRDLTKKIMELAGQKGCKQVKLTSATAISSKLYEQLGFVKKDQDYFAKTLN